MALENLRIVGLRAENIQRLKVVEIEPKAGLVEVSGRNRQGKSSLLDAISMALAGGDAIPWQPIRTGEEKALIRLDLGNDEGLQLRLTRRFTAQEEGAKTYTTSLKIEGPDGGVHPKAQTLLQSLISGVSFDPQEFIDAKPDEQAEILRKLVKDFDFAAAEENRKQAYAARTDANRDAKQALVRAEAIAVEPGLPKEAPDIEALVAKLSEIGAAHREYEQRLARRRAFVEENDRIADDIEVLTEKLAMLVKTQAARAEQMKEWPDLAQPKDASAIRDQVEAARAIEGKLAKRTERDRLKQEADEAQLRSEGFTRKITAIDDSVAKAIASADLPDGLTIDSGRVMLRGVPFDQASSAEQLRTSIGIGLKLNPKLRVMRIKHGAFFDDAAWGTLAEIADETETQIWCESITAHGPEAIVMEDGEAR